MQILSTETRINPQWTKRLACIVSSSIRFRKVIQKSLVVLQFAVLSAAVSAGFGDFVFAKPFLPSFRDSAAYRQFLKRRETEMSKLLYLLDRFKEVDFKVLYDGAEYDSAGALREAKKYIGRHYNKKDKAAEWIKRHAYRSEPGGRIIYLKFSGETQQFVLRDLLLEELEALERARV